MKGPSGAYRKVRGMKAEETYPLNKTQEASNEHDVYTEHRTSTASIFMFVFVGMCILFGLAGNNLVLFYYIRIVRGGSTRILALGLVSFHLLSCLIVMPLQIYMTSLTLAHRPQDARVCKFFWGMQSLGIGGGAWFLAALTYEMQRKLFVPFSLPSVDRRRVLGQVVFGVIVAVTFSLPAFALSGVSCPVGRPLDQLAKDRDCFVCFLEPHFVGTYIALAYHSIASACLIAVTCFVVTINLRISGLVYQPQTPSASSTSSNCSQDRLRVTSRFHRSMLLKARPRYNFPPSTEQPARLPSVRTISCSTSDLQLQDGNLFVPCSRPAPSPEASKSGSSKRTEGNEARSSAVPASSGISRPSCSSPTAAEEPSSEAGCVAGLCGMCARACGYRDNRLRPTTSSDELAPPATSAPDTSYLSTLPQRGVQPVSRSAASGLRPPPATSVVDISDLSMLLQCSVQPVNRRAFSRLQPRSQNVPRDSITSEQARSTARCNLCLISLLVAAQYLPYAIFMVMVVINGPDGVFKIWTTNSSIAFQLIYRSIFIGCAANPYAFFVSESRFRLCVERFLLKVRHRHKPRVTRAVGPWTCEDTVERGRRTQTEREEDSL